MLKCLTVMAIVTALAVVWILYRQRIRMGFKAGATLYILLVAARLIQSSSDEERITTLAMGLAPFAAVWCIVWLATTIILRRRESRRPHS